MQRHGIKMNGRSKIYAPDAIAIHMEVPEVVAAKVVICPKRRVKDIRFYGEDILPGNWLVKRLILEPDTKAGIISYEASR